MTRPSELRTPRFKFTQTFLQGLYVVERCPIVDKRGYFERAYCEDEFSKFGLISTAQINRSFTHEAGIIRGMHYQAAPNSEQKIITCLSGEIFDVAVDVREKSPTFGQWFGIVLSARNAISLLIPPGFAHGYQTLVPDTHIEYFVSSPFAPDSEAGINPKDPTIAISWPLPCSGMSEKDRCLPLIEI